MNKDTNQNPDQLATFSLPKQQIFPPLETVTRPTVPTDSAAYYLNRRPQTLRSWACFENGLIKPIRINGRLAWPVSEIRKILGWEV